MPTEPAVHRIILVVDIEHFGNPQRTNRQQLLMREELYRALEASFTKAAIPWKECYNEDRGDGALVLTPPEVPKSYFVERLPLNLVEVLRRHNGTHPEVEKIRLRMAIHAGEVHYDDHGVTGQSVNLAFRLIEAGVLKTALANSHGDLAVIVSPWFHDEVVRNVQPDLASLYHSVNVSVKETSGVAWMFLPDEPGLTQERVDRWQAAARQPAGCRVLTGHAGPVRTLACAVVDGQPVVVSGGEDRILRVWDLNTGDLRTALGGHSDVILAVGFIQVGSGPIAVSGGMDGALRIWDLANNKLVATPRRSLLDRAFNYPIVATAFCSIDGRPVVVTAETGLRGINDGADNRVRVWDLIDMEWRATLFNRPQARSLSGIACAELDGVPVAIFSREFGKLEVWRLDTRQHDRSIRRPISLESVTETINDVKTGQLGTVPVAVTCGSKGDVWNLQTRKRMFSLEVNSTSILTIANGRLRNTPVTIMGCADGKIRVWDLVSHGLLLTRDAGSAVYAVACNIQEDRILVAAGTHEGTILVWNLAEEIDSDREHNRSR